MKNNKVEINLEKSLNALIIKKKVKYEKPKKQNFNNFKLSSY